jgi:plasmid stabilization system protein ParE
VKARRVGFTPEAEVDLAALYDLIAAAAAPAVAMRYLDRLEAFCAGMAVAAERGRRRDDIRTGLRIVGFERRVTIAFTVSEDAVTILRVFYAGRNWEAAL